MTTKLGVFCSLALTIAMAGAALGQPDLFISTAETAADQPVSVYTVPDGAGRPLSNCYALGGNDIDATVTLTLLDALADPIIAYPREDLWIETTLGGLVTCAEGSLADSSTDADGETTFSQAFYGGGQSVPANELAQVLVSGFPLQSSPGLDIQFNSPDINGDLRVDLCDVVIFAGTYFGSYDYDGDFKWDGTVNLADVSMMAPNIAARCPDTPEPAATPPNLHSRLGIYFDTEASFYCAQDVEFGQYSGFLIATEIGETGGLAGWEAAIELVGPGFVLDLDVPVQYLNFGFEEFVVGLSEPMPWQPAIVLAEISLFIADDSEPITFALGPTSVYTAGPYPAYAPPGEACNTVPIWPSCSHGEVAVINGPCPEVGLELSTEELVIRVEPDMIRTMPLTIHDTGTVGGSVAALLWEIADPACDWLAVAPLSGTIEEPGGAAEIAVTADGTDKEAGSYECELTIVSNACHRPYATVLVQMLVIPGASAVDDLPSSRLAVSAYPNPFNPSTKITYTVPRAGEVEIAIYSVTGRLVKQLLRENVAAGQGSLNWDGTDASGRAVSSGVYLCRVRAGGEAAFQKVALIE